MDKSTWGKWQSIASDVLTILMAVLPQIDSIYGTHLTSNPAYSAGLAILGAAGIHAHTMQQQHLEL